MMRMLTSKVASSPLGDISSPAPNLRQWSYGLFAALAIHAIGAAPFLPKPIDESLTDDGIGEPTEIGVNLAPIIQPPEPPPEVEPEPEPDIPVVEERATDSPPPAPPAKPRELPDLPDIQPKAVPDLWRGSGGGSVTLEEYLLLKNWLSEARAVILNEITYPPEAATRSLFGSASIIITATSEGRIADWSFQQRTGYTILDREVSRTVRSIRRLPRFPDGISYNTLSFIVPIRFVVMENGAILNGDARDLAAVQNTQPSTVQGLSVDALARCAGAAAQLMSRRDEIDATRVDLESEREYVERDVNRYARERKQAPRRVQRRIDDYNDKIAEYDTLVSEFQQQSEAYSALCEGGRADWESYALACSPYRTAGNVYCEAFTDLWLRIQAGQ